MQTSCHATALMIDGKSQPVRIHGSRMRAPGPGVPTFPMTGPEGERRIGVSVIFSVLRLVAADATRATPPRWSSCR